MTVMIDYDTRNKLIEKECDNALKHEWQKKRRLTG